MDCLLTAISSALGQLFIFATISKFGPVVFTIIMTVRQVLKNYYYLFIFYLFNRIFLFFIFRDYQFYCRVFSTSIIYREWAFWVYL